MHHQPARSTQWNPRRRPGTAPLAQPSTTWWRLFLTALWVLAAGLAAQAGPVLALGTPAEDATGIGAATTLSANLTAPQRDATPVTFYGRKVTPVAAGPDFTLVTLPDTQFYSENAGGQRAATFSAVLDWADALLKAHPNRRAIVTSHWMVNTGYPASFSPQGQAIYDRLKANPNLFLLLGGHVSGEGRRTDTYQGHTVYSILQDYQGRANGGDGWLRYFVFSPANNTITALTYQVANPLTPNSARFETHANSQFTLAYGMHSALSDWAPLGKVSVAAGTTAASLTWSGLEAGARYEWLASTADALGSDTAAARHFSTAAAPTTTAITIAATTTTTITTAAANAPPAQYVILISVDGMGSEYVKPLLKPGLTNELATFERIQAEGSGTLNARDDANYAITLPNHTTMVTGRGVVGPAGHNWTTNTDPAAGVTIASNKGSYVASIFDVVHDHGLRTGIWSGKSKFSLYHQSYSATSGAPDITGPDNGRDKIDYEKIVPVAKAADLTAEFARQMAAKPFNFAFFHYQDPDATGHALGWSADPASPYATSLKSVDTQIGKILDMVRANPTLNGHTTIILTSDHGGHDKTHGDTKNPLDYTIPFYVWGAGVAAGGDLYALNPTSRSAPAASANPPYTGPQPVRNGDAANLALSLLGLGPVPDSTIDSAQDLKLAKPAP